MKTVNKQYIYFFMIILSMGVGLTCFGFNANIDDRETELTNSMGLFTKQQELERDSIIKNRQINKWWDMDIDPNKYHFNIHIPNEQTSKRQGGIIVTKEEPRTGKSDNNYNKRQALSKKHVTQNEINNLRKGNAYTQRNIDRINKIGEENRRRIEAQNALDRQRGFQEYYMRMGDLHAKNAARDEWMMTEGVKRLNNVHAIDMANLPQEKTDHYSMNIESGKDLACMLKEKEKVTAIKVEMTIRDEERTNKRGIALSATNKTIDLYDNGSYNKTINGLWIQSVTQSDPYLSLPSKVKYSKEYEKVLLLKKTQFDLNGLYVTSLPGMGCVVLLGDSVLVLDNDELPILEWGAHADVSEVVTCGPRTFAKQGKRVIEINNGQTTDVMVLENDEYHIYPETDNTFIICAHYFDMSIVLRININSSKYDEILRITHPIEKICANRNVVFALIGDRIIDITQRPTLFYKSSRQINDITMCREGLLVSTDDNVLLFRTEEDICILSKDGAQRLWCDGIDIYLLNNKGDLFRYSNKYKLS